MRRLCLRHPGLLRPSERTGPLRPRPRFLCGRSILPPQAGLCRRFGAAGGHDGLARRGCQALHHQRDALRLLELLEHGPRQHPRRGPPGRRRAPDHAQRRQKPRLAPQVHRAGPPGRRPPASDRAGRAHKLHPLTKKRLLQTDCPGEPAAFIQGEGPPTARRCGRRCRGWRRGRTRTGRCSRRRARGCRTPCGPPRRCRLWCRWG